MFLFLVNSFKSYYNNINHSKTLVVYIMAC